MDIEYILWAEGIDYDRLDDYTQQALDSLRTHVDADRPEATARPGEKGNLVAIGTLVLKFVQTKAAAALIGVFKSLLDRDSRLQLTLKLKRTDGATLELAADHLRPEQYDRTIAVTENFLKGDGSK
jgi:hypothetical protein